METTSLSQQKLQIEDRPLLMRMLFLALSGAGLMLIVGTIREHGVQSWYRFTYIAGIVMGIVGVAIFFRVVKGYRVVFDKQSGRVHFQEMLGFSVSKEKVYSFSAFRELRVERKKAGVNALNDQEVFHYRIAARFEGKGWVPFTPHFQKKPHDLKAVVSSVNMFMDMRQ
ncbi:MAG: hypothetical protein AAF206_14640 [Bacteroidota bacterium]